ncbi:MAG: hypothetical protein WCD86_15260 [Ktedonobacteraceae bacterium]
MIVIIAVCVVVLFETVLLLLLLRALGELRQRGKLPTSRAIQYPDIGGLAVGEQAPLFVAKYLDGNEFRMEHLHGHHILAFVEPGCSACNGAMSALNKLMQERPEFTVVAVGGLDQRLNRAYAIEFGAHMPILTPDLDVGNELYRIPMVPFVFVLDEASIIKARGVVNHFGHLRDILAEASVLIPVVH